MDWTGGLDWWTGLVDWTGGMTLKTIYTLFNKTYSPVEICGNPHQPSLCTHSHGTNKYRPTVIVKSFVASNVILVFVIVETACSYDYG